MSSFLLRRMVQDIFNFHRFLIFENLIVYLPLCEYPQLTTTPPIRARHWTEFVLDSNLNCKMIASNKVFMNIH